MKYKMHLALALGSSKNLSHADVLADRIAELLVELDHLRIAGPHLQIELRAAHLPQAALGFEHDRPPIAPVPLFMRHRHAINPSAISIESGERSCDHSSTDHTDEK